MVAQSAVADALVLNTFTKRATLNGREIRLTKTEWRILSLLSDGSTRQLPKRTDKWHIPHLRQKGISIGSRLGFGYYLEGEWQVYGPPPPQTEKLERKCIGHVLCNGATIYCNR